MKNWIVTGGAGTGKSTFCRMLAEVLDGAVESFSCDQAAGRLWNDPEVQARLVAEFGNELAVTGQSVTRRSVADLVFRVEEARKRLEAVMHPRIFQMLDMARDHAQKKGDAKVFLAEVPLYYETQQPMPADTVIVVAASETVQRTRLIKHRQIDASVADGMLNAQLPLELKINKADVVVWNDGSSAVLETQMLILLRSLRPFN
ncbi:MAG: dephospho-CoA kinase [Verrucomicrobiaceae bacterium]|nr:dephospho-CoA kinase [Verrucomicrobiaceae bacterium]